MDGSVDIDIVRLGESLSLNNKVRQFNTSKRGLENGFFRYDLAARTATIWDDGNSVFTLTNAEKLGRLVVAVLEHPEATANKNLYVTSVQTSQNDILSALEKTTGSKWTVTKATTEKEISERVEKLGKGDFTGPFPSCERPVLQIPKAFAQAMSRRKSWQTSCWDCNWRVLSTLSAR
jgi:hypothetical protein